jgi:hypothetical protein
LKISDADLKKQQSADELSFVLVHGAWHGGRCWRSVRDLLQKFRIAGASAATSMTPSKYGRENCRPLKLNCFGGLARE